MEYNYPKFTPEMKQTHTILIPNMAITQFRLLEYALRYDGYKCEILGNCGSAVAQLGLKYVHNDTCYPALLVIGQFLDALNSGKYDLDHTALLITQTGGGCRASCRWPAARWPAFSTAICSVPCAIRWPPTRTKRVPLTGWSICGSSVWAAFCWPARALLPGK